MAFADLVVSLEQSYAESLSNQHVVIDIGLVQLISDMYFYLLFLMLIKQYINDPTHCCQGHLIDYDSSCALTSKTTYLFY